MTQTNPSFRYLLSHPNQLLAFGFGAGLAPKAPGTFGTLVAIPFYYLMQGWPLSWYLALIVVTFAWGVYLCGVTAKAQNCHDHSGIVWDEMVGYWITMILAPSAWWWMIIGFVLFRIFDILKPWPISWLDKKVHGGLGIMIDDVLAGIFALVCMQLFALVAAGL